MCTAEMATMLDSRLVDTPNFDSGRRYFLAQSWVLMGGMDLYDIKLVEEI